MTFTVEVIVVGAGPAGIATAATLARMGISTALIDDARTDVNRPGEGLAPAGVEALARLGWHFILNQTDTARPYLGVKSIWHATAPEFSDDMLKSPIQGMILDREIFDRRLLSRAVYEGVEHLPHVSITSVKMIEHGVLLEGSRDGHPWQGAAKFVVDATGKGARIARAFGVRRRRVTNQIATAISLPPASAPNAHENWVLIEADSGGWWYGATGPDRRRHLAHFSAKPAATPTSNVDLAELLRRSRMMNCFVMPEEARSCDRRQFDAGCSLLEVSCGQRWIAVGEAAAAFDPIASQGLTHAFGSARAAAGAVTRALTGHLDGFANYMHRTNLTMERHLLGLRDHYSNCQAGAT